MFLALAILAIGFLILIHELGHFLAARAAGMRVESFSIGFGPALLSIRGKATEYRIALLPLGGYVRIAGMAPGDGTPEDDPASFARKPAWQRFLVILAGPFINWLFAFLLLAGLLVAGIQQASPEPVIGRVADGSAAAAAGLQAGDRIVSLDGEPIAAWPELVRAIKVRRGQVMEIVLQRGEAELTLHATTGEDGKLGVLPSTHLVRKPLGASLGEAFVQTGVIIQRSLASLGDLLRGTGDAQIMGPVGIVSETREAARGGLQSLFGILVMISLALALMNLLPLPALDGGRLVFIAIAMVRRRPVNAKVEAVIHGLGMLLLLGLVAYATYGDIGRQLGRDEPPAPPPAEEARPPAP